MTLDDLAGRLDAASDTLAGAGAAFDRMLGARSFGADAPGRLGELGRQLHAGWAEAAHARQREAVVHADRLAEIAAAVRSASATYRDTDDDSRDHRGGQEPTG